MKTKRRDVEISWFTAVTYALKSRIDIGKILKVVVERETNATSSKCTRLAEDDIPFNS